MKKILISITIILFLVSCKSSNIDKDNCNENMKFKQTFFYHIKYIGNNIGILQDSTFIKSVIFISNYAPVSTDKIMNYSRAYPIGIFENDQKKWIEWYEENKCKNIQFKNNYATPEAYKNNSESDW